jgi:signal transduction histidine kinase
MSDKSSYFFNKNFSVYLTDANKTLIAENYETAFQTSEDMKPAKAFMILFNNACDEGKKTADSKALAEMSQRIPALETIIQDKDEEILRLQKLLNGIEDLRKEDMEKMQATIDRLTLVGNDISAKQDIIDNQIIVIQQRDKIIENLQNEIENLRKATNSPDGAVMVLLTPSEHKVIKAICDEESKRTGKPVTPEILFKNVFFFVLINGPHDMFSAPVALRKIQELSKLT